MIKDYKKEENCREFVKLSQVENCSEQFANYHYVIIK